MNKRVNPLVVIYLLVVFLPVAIVTTTLTALITIIMSTLFGDHKWGYYPAMVWSRIICATALIRVTVVGKEHYNPKKSYIFIANHQSLLDVFLIYGWLNSRFKWIIKEEARQVPLVGKACESAGHIFIDRSNGVKAKRSMEKAEEKLRNGSSVVIFPEGSRTRMELLVSSNVARSRLQRIYTYQWCQSPFVVLLKRCHRTLYILNLVAWRLLFIHQ